MMIDWGLQSGAGIWLGGHATDGKRLLHHLLSDMARPPVGPIDAAFISPETIDEAIHFSQKLSVRLGPSQRLWIITSNSPPSDQATAWLDLDDRMFELGFTKVAVVDVDTDYQTRGYEHTTLA